MGGDVADYDVVVLGSGLAGSCAALEAAAAGARVLIAEAEEKPGGRSQFSTGMIMGAGSRFQRERGMADDAEALFRHYMTSTSGRSTRPSSGGSRTRRRRRSSGWPISASRSSTCTSPATSSCRAGT
jgi:flavin-dependent dehydrogenase